MFLHLPSENIWNIKMFMCWVVCLVKAWKIKKNIVFSVDIDSNPFDLPQSESEFVQDSEDDSQHGIIILSLSEPKFLSERHRPLASTFSNIISSEASRPVEVKSHVNPLWNRGTKVCSTDLRYVIKRFYENF